MQLGVEKEMLKITNNTRRVFEAYLLALYIHFWLKDLYKSLKYP